MNSKTNKKIVSKKERVMLIAVVLAFFVLIGAFAMSISNYKVVASADSLNVIEDGLIIKYQPYWGDKAVAANLNNVGGEHRVHWYYYDGYINQSANTYTIYQDLINGVSDFLYFDEVSCTHIIEDIFARIRGSAEKTYTIFAFGVKHDSQTGAVIEGAPILLSNLFVLNEPNVVDLPEAPTKEGHTFVGWYYDSNFTNAYKVGDVIYENTTLYAKFDKNIYTITFNLLGQEKAYTYEYGKTVKVHEMFSSSSIESLFNDFGVLNRKPNAYSYVGVFFEYQGQRITVDEIEVEQDYYLYVDLLEKTVKVVFIVDGEEYISLDIPYGSTLVNQNTNSPLMARALSTFSNIFTDVDFSQPFAISEEITSDMTLYAQLTPKMATWIDIGNWLFNYWYWLVVGFVVLVVIIGLAIYAVRK